MRRFIAAAAALGLLAATSAAAPQHVNRIPVRHGAPCSWHHGQPVLFTVHQAARAGAAAWGGAGTPSRHDWRRLLFFARCQRNPRASSFVHAMYRGFARANAHRQWEAAHPAESVVASWYDDGGHGATASGFTAYYGFADCGSGGFCVPFGTRVKFCYAGRCVTGVADDHGPYVGGRDVDVNQNIEGVLGFDGVARISARVL